ncbi:MAG: RNA polymerase factor sigma-54 [Thermodesulfobacteriota bacterium]|nr:RNA polymerase factor sigma-54 [Thermodesulfobacteriota bacterium]
MATLELKQNLKLTQQLTMTPQLKMAIKLLQLSRLELIEHLSQELEANPVLEEDTDMEGEEKTHELPIEEIDFKEGEGEEIVKNEVIDEQWRSFLEGKSREGFEETFEEEKLKYSETILTKKESLAEYLLWQLLLSSFTKEEEEVGRLIIGNIDKDGYLRIPIEELSVTSKKESTFIESVLKKIQEFDPPGVGARDLKECLLIQLKYLEGDYDLVARIITDHLYELEERNYHAIAKKLDVKIEDIMNAAKIISGFEPKPGRPYSEEETIYIVPDFYVQKVGDDFFVILDEDGLPKLKVSSFYYQSLLNRNNENDTTTDYLQDKIRSAMWLIKSIYKRQKTLYKVMNSILKFQVEFFEKGTRYIKPLVLKDVADDIGVHESTVSRVTKNKYVSTPYGVLELKYFFNSRIEANNGEGIGSGSVKERIKQIIAKEDSQKPLSDLKIERLLRAENMDIARRTVAKYREMMGIPPSSKRKKFFSH